MAKALCMVGIVIAVVLFFVFGLDLVVGFPFGQASKTIDMGFVASSVILGVIAWLTFREQV
jgi:hypothetical protein